MLRNGYLVNLKPFPAIERPHDLTLACLPSLAPCAGGLHSSHLGLAVTLLCLSRFTCITPFFHVVLFSWTHIFFCPLPLLLTIV